MTYFIFTYHSFQHNIPNSLNTTKNNTPNVTEYIETYTGLNQILVHQAPRIKNYIKEINIANNNVKGNKYDNLLGEYKPNSLIKKLQINELTLESKNLIEKIDGIYNKIEIELLNKEQQLEIDNLYNKRLTQLISQYQKLTPEYIFKHSDQDGSPDKLLLESLQTVYEKMHNIAESIMHQHHNQLKVTHQYLKNI